MKRSIWIIALLFGVAGIGLAFVTLLSTSRITCQISNTGSEIVTDVRVSVAGNSSILRGDLNPGASWRVTLTPQNQAGGVELSFARPDGSIKTEVLVGYVESKNYRGEVRAEIIEDGAVRIVSNTIGTGLF